MFMGSCFSSVPTNSSFPPTAKVVALDGSLKEYSIAVTVSFVLGADHLSCFLCSSDKLYFDTYIPALDSKDLLEPGQIYFVLPIAKLDYRLSGSDMAALAIKAGSALALAFEKRGKNRRIRVMPVAEACEGDGVGELDGFKRFDEDSVGVSGSWSVKKKMGKRANIRARMASRPCNRERLNTIEEVDE